MAEQDLLVRVKLENDLSRPMDEVRAKVKGTADEITRTGRSSTGTATELSRLERAASAAGTGIGYLGTHLLVADRSSSMLSGTIGRLGAAYAGASLVRWGVDAVQSANQARSAFDTYLGSVDKSRDLYAELGAMKTPFGQSALAGASQNLLAMGVTADQVLPSVRAIADAVSARGGGQNALSAAAAGLADINSSATVTADQLRTLQRAGLDASGTLGKSRGLTGQQLLAGLDRGSVRLQGAQVYDELIAGFEQQSAGKAAAAASSLQGTLASVSTTFGQAVNKAWTPELSEQVGAFVGGLAQMIPPLAQVATPFLQVLGDTLGFLGDHPHLTEGLAGLLVFREVAGFALQTSDAVRQISGALASGNTGGALRQLLGPGGGGAGSALNAAGQAASAADGGPADTVNSLKDTVGEDHKVGKAIAQAGLITTALATASEVYTGVGGIQGSLQAKYGHGYDGRSWHIQDAGKGAAQTLQDSALGLTVGAGVGTALGGPIGTGIGAVVGGTVGAIGGVGKSTWEYFHDRQGYSLSAAGKTARDAAAQAASVTAPVQVNVTTGTSAADIQTAMLAQLQSPEFRAQMQAAIDESARQDRLRGRGGN